MTTRVIALLLALSAAACARESTPIRQPSQAPMLAPPPWFYAPPPASPMLAGVGVAAEPTASSSPSLPVSPAQPPARVPAKRTDSGSASRGIPGGEACLALLDQAGVAYQRTEAKKGVDTPIRVMGPLGGVRYEAGAGHPMVCDCRLAVALHRIGPTFQELGVSSLRFSGAYSYRMSRVGRLSLHAHGLALDVHEAVMAGLRLSVKRDFARGLADGCSAQAPALNQLACRLGATALFKELLTPDSNADHHDHFHLAIAPVEDPSRSRDAKRLASLRP